MKPFAFTATSLAVGALVVACVGDSPAVTTADSGGPDTGSPGDAGGDAADAAPTFCSGHKTAAFCEDFDRAAAPPWSLTDSMHNLGTFAANVDTFTSAPRSVLFLLNPAAGTFQGAFLSTVVQTSTAKGARLSLSMRFDELDPTAGQMDFFILRTDGVGGITVHRTTTSNTDVWAFGPSFETIDTPPLGQWLPVVFDVTFDDADAGADAGGNGTATLTLGTKTYPAIPSKLKAPSSTVGLLLGGQSTAPTSPKTHYSIDDVVLELK